ncbi:solute carrier family 23 protein [Acinetobacter sp. HY1485]|uniref:solute carrier family 23 protein n=1 Tax=Acinetobacter sp. HY1485 TaxID=2970918 RepID=UPI0022B9494B|nr:solute carrier family 23 protein [Acinetobacter sp. HY1485]
MVFQNFRENFATDDFMSGLVVFLVALPLCLGIALASGAPLLAGIISGVIGGIIVGALSGSHISVSGPAAGLTAIIIAQLELLNGNYQAFLVSVVLAGILQVIFGTLKLGSFANFVPNNVILGLLAAIGLILIIGQTPRLFGTDTSTIANTWHDPMALWSGLDQGAAIIGVLSIVIILGWDKFKPKTLPIPSALLAVVLAGVFNFILVKMNSNFAVTTQNLIQLPQILGGNEKIFFFPDFSFLSNSQIYIGAVTVAIVASLETLLNLEAADKMDPQKRTSPPNRELVAQGVGNTVSGLVGGMPLTSVIVRSSVNATSGAKTKFSAIFHGILLIIAVLFLTPLINYVPLSALAAILLLTGYKLAKPTLFVHFYKKGWKQFLPFIVTVIAIIATDLLIGILIGLTLSALFILYNNLHRGVRTVHEKHVHGTINRIELSQNVSFLNRAALVSALAKIKDGETVVIDASQTYYIDPDLYAVIEEFQQETAKKHQINVKLVGFKAHYPELEDEELDIDVSTKDLQAQLTPEAVLEKLKEGNSRFANHERLHHNIGRQIQVTSQEGQHPIAAVLGCMDSRAPVEMLFDVGVGDLFSLRIAGNIAGQKVLGSLEFACQEKGSKLIVVLGHTDCGAITSACHIHQQGIDISQSKEMPHIQHIIKPIVAAIEGVKAQMSDYQLTTNFVEDVTRMNVRNNIAYIVKNSDVLRGMIERNEIGIVGAIYDVKTGKVEFLS